MLACEYQRSHTSRTHPQSCLLDGQVSRDIYCRPYLCITGPVVTPVTLMGLGNAEGPRMTLRQGSKSRYSSPVKADKLLSGANLH